MHLMCDNYATHKTDTIQRWLATHPRFHVHFVPTSSSSLARELRRSSRSWRPPSPATSSTRSADPGGGLLIRAVVQELVEAGLDLDAGLTLHP